MKKATTPSDPYVYVVERRLNDTYGCSLHRYTLVKKNKTSVTVMDRGRKKIIVENAVTVISLNEQVAIFTTRGIMLGHLARMKENISKLKKMVTHPAGLMRCVEPDLSQVPEGPLVLD